MRVIAIVNQKGGCGKTTTTVNLAGALAADGNRVLVVDMDPQAHATLALGLEPDELEANLYEVLIEPAGATRLDSIIVDVTDQIDVAPSSIVLSALEQKLATERHDARTQRLSAALENLPPLYDYVLIDCPPNVGLLTFNALRSANEVIVPLETSFFAIDGVQKLLETIGLLSDRIGHELHVRVLPTLYDGRTRYARQTLGDIRELFKELCFDSVIRLNVKLREAARKGLPISHFAPSANGALDHASVVPTVKPVSGRRS
jgi:chromosome partitioning protein